MKRAAVLVLALVCMQALISCGQAEQKQQGDNDMQYFFSGKVVEVDKEYLLIEVNDTGNSNLSEGASVEVSSDVAYADGLPAFVVDEYARVLMAQNTDNNSSERLEALSVYKIDETGRMITD